MVSVSAGRPQIRQRRIQDNITQLNWANDRHLKAFGIEINRKMLTTEGRLLTEPSVYFKDKNSPTQPNVKSHRWNISKTIFEEAIPLKYWAVVSFDLQKDVLDGFLKAFRRVYRSHSGQQPPESESKALPGSDWGDWTQNKIKDELRALADRSTKKAPKGTCQIIFFIVPDGDSRFYENIKYIMDCVLKIPSQVLQKVKVVKPNDQYCSNVALKVNAKLGGINFHAAPNPHSYLLPTPTMFIGLDVSHAPAGTNQPSMAALTASLDRGITRYGAACQTNGIYTEIVAPATIKAFASTLHS